MKPQSSLKKSSVKAPAERVVKDIRRQTRRHFSAEDKIRIVLDGLRGDDSIAELCRKEGIAQSLYYVWSKEFMEAGKRRLAGDTAIILTNRFPETATAMMAGSGKSEKDLLSVHTRQCSDVGCFLGKRNNVVPQLV
jgi:transposase-like protein